MSCLNWKEIVFNNKQEARNTFVALVDYNMNGKTKHYDGMAYLFRKLYPDNKNEYLYDIVEANQYGATVATYHLRLDIRTKKIYLKAFDYSLRTELFFDIILNNIKEILAHQTCFAVDISNISSSLSAIPPYVIAYSDATYSTIIRLNGYSHNLTISEQYINRDKSNYISINYTEDLKYMYVSISKKDKLIIKKLKRYFLYLYVKYINDYIWKSQKKN